MYKKALHTVEEIEINLTTEQSLLDMAERSYSTRFRTDKKGSSLTCLYSLLDHRVEAKERRREILLYRFR
jgi:hypothetical protein